MIISHVAPLCAKNNIFLITLSLKIKSAHSGFYWLTQERTMDMKHYTVELKNNWFGDYKVIVFNEDEIEEYCALVSSFNIEGYCQCLADMGYAYFIDGVNHDQFI